jgi:hypothetical protein
MIFNRMEAFKAFAPTLADKQLVDRIHGWGEEYEESRYQSTVWPLVAVVVCAAVLIWGLQPWS